MGNIVLHIANAGVNLTESDLAIVESAVKSAEGFVSDKFDFDYDVDLIVVGPSLLMKTSPDDGINARTYNSKLMILTIDAIVTAVSEDRIFELVCHEMSHSIRWAKNPEYVSCLFDDIILEGLAVVLEEEAIASTHRLDKRPFLTAMQETDKNVAENMKLYFGDKLYDTGYNYFPDDYSTIFYSGNETLPPQAGYRLGYHLVKSYISRTGQSIYEITTLPYMKFREA